MSQTPAIIAPVAERKLSGLSLPKVLSNLSSYIHKAALSRSLAKLGATVIGNNYERHCEKSFETSGNISITVSHIYTGYPGEFLEYHSRMKMELSPEGKVVSLLVQGNNETTSVYNDPDIINSNSVIRGIIGVLRAKPSYHESGAVLKVNKLSRKLTQAKSPIYC